MFTVSARGLRLSSPLFVPLDTIERNRADVERENQSSLRWTRLKHVFERFFITLLLFIVSLKRDTIWICWTRITDQWRRSTFIEDQGLSRVLLRRGENGDDSGGSLWCRYDRCFNIYQTISITYDAINRDSLLLRRPTYIFRSISTSETSPIFRHRLCFGYLSSIGTRIPGFVKLVDLIN